MRIDTNDKQLVERLNRIWNHCKEVIKTEEDLYYLIEGMANTYRTSELPFPTSENRRWFYEDLATHCVSQKYEGYAQQPSYRIHTGKKTFKHYDAEEWTEGELMEMLLIGNNLSTMARLGDGVGRLEISMISNLPAEKGFPVADLSKIETTEDIEGLDFPTREKTLV